MYMPMSRDFAPAPAAARTIALEREDAIDFRFSPQLAARYDKSRRALWLRWRPQGRTCFSPSLLADLRAFCDLVEGGNVAAGASAYPVEYTVLASSDAHAFNLGGDLDLFVRLIEARDRDGLSRYGRACVDVLYRNYTGYGLPLTTVSLVQGECLGGGFEAALSSDVLIAEESARFGFPEILFNLFPGMGAYSFLSRRIGMRATEDLLSSGQILGAREMHALGVVDVVVPDGAGEAEVEALIARRGRSRNGLAAIAAARRRVQALTHDELVDVVELWVDAALRLGDRDLRLMRRIVGRQTGHVLRRAAA